MLIGGFVFFQMFFLVLSVAFFGPVSILILFGGTGCGLAVVGIIGAVVFSLVRVMNASMKFPIPSRWAVVLAASLTGLCISVLFLLFLLTGTPLSFAKLQLESSMVGPVFLTAFLQAGAWLGADLEIRRFGQRAVVSDSDIAATGNQRRFGIAQLMMGTFWLAGTLGILGSISRMSNLDKDGLFVLAGAFSAAFLSLSCAAVLVGLTKTLRALQKAVFRGLQWLRNMLFHHSRK